MGLGTKMLDYTIGFLEKNFQSCVSIWLHVIDYNESAIRFYLKNKFIKYQRLKHHYYIDEKDFDAIVLYRAIGRLKLVVNNNIRKININNMMDEEDPEANTQAATSAQFVMPDLRSTPECYDSD